MNFKKYLKNIEKKFVEQTPTRKIESDTKITEEKKILSFVDSNKDPEPKQTIDTKQSSKLNKSEQKQNINLKSDEEPKASFNDFIDERELISHNAFGDKEMKIKILEISDEVGQTPWKFGDRVKINKILITIKHLKDQQIEESEFDIEEIENELTEKRHYTSTNRWVPTKEIKNGYLINSRHTSMISDAAALDYIIF